MTNPNNLITEPFSDGYSLVLDVDVYQHNSDTAIIDVELLDSLRQRFPSPIIGYIGGLHYQFKPEIGIPSGAVALPEDNHDDPDALLIQR